MNTLTRIISIDYYTIMTRETVIVLVLNALIIEVVFDYGFLAFRMFHIFLDRLRLVVSFFDYFVESVWAVFKMITHNGIGFFIG